MMHMVSVVFLEVPVNACKASSNSLLLQLLFHYLQHILNWSVILFCRYILANDPLCFCSVLFLFIPFPICVSCNSLSVCPLVPCPYVLSIAYLFCISCLILLDLSQCVFICFTSWFILKVFWIPCLCSTSASTSSKSKCFWFSLNKSYNLHLRLQCLHLGPKLCFPALALRPEHDMIMVNANLSTVMVDQELTLFLHTFQRGKYRM